SGAQAKRRSRGTKRMQRTSASDVTPLLRPRPGMTSPSYETPRPLRSAPCYAARQYDDGPPPDVVVEAGDWSAAADFGDVVGAGARRVDDALPLGQSAFLHAEAHREGVRVDHHVEVFFGEGGAAQAIGQRA